MTKKQEFIKAVMNLQDWDIYIPYTHAYHESGAFTKVIGDYNFWGIKVPNGWSGKVVMVPTHEYINGVKTAVMDNFIDFNSMPEALDWYVNFIKRLYSKSYEARHDHDAYYSNLVSNNIKYATDPTYAMKLVKLYEVLKQKQEIERS